MSQWWRGHENGGWNRVTQELIDTGTYMTGQPAVDIDADYGNSDGIISEKKSMRLSLICSSLAMEVLAIVEASLLVNLKIL